MKKRLIFPLLAFAAGALACQAVPLHLAGLASPTATPSPTTAQTLTATFTSSPAPTQTLAPAFTPSPAQKATSLPPTPLAPVEFHDGRSEETNAAGQYALKLRYPQLDAVQAPGAPAFNQVVVDFVQQQVADFKKNAADLTSQQPDSNGSYFGLDYKVFYNQAGLVSLQFSIDTYMQGAAHPNLVTFPLNYDLQSGQRVELKNLFKPGSGYLKPISALCLADLQKRDFPVTLDGAAPTPGNYRSWNITPAGLRITFDAYQVAAYAAGPQSVEIPWKNLESLLDARLAVLFLAR